jgi:NAD(P)-dependent dehydrogenase (short-subunit alcohol dehydrogenase family)
MPGLQGRIALVTGGRGTRPLAMGLAGLGATVVISGPQAVARRIALATGNPRVHGLELDLTSPASVRQGAQAFLERYEHLHVLVTEVTVRLGPVLLANLLLDTMKQSGRVVRLSPAGDRRQIWAAR